MSAEEGGQNGDLAGLDTVSSLCIQLISGCPETVISISGSKIAVENRERGQIVYEKHVVN